MLPFSAPSRPPETGPSIKSSCRRANSPATRSAVSALTVEVSSTTLPAGSSGASCPLTSSRSRSADTQVMTRSASVVAAAMLPASAKPCVFAAASPRPGERFQAPASRPARWRLPAMPAPMAPRPMTEVLIMRGLRPRAVLTGNGAHGESAAGAVILPENRMMRTPQQSRELV